MHSNASTTGPPLFLSFQFLRPFDLPTVGIPVSIRPLLPCSIETILKKRKLSSKRCFAKNNRRVLSREVYKGAFDRCGGGMGFCGVPGWGFQAGGPSHKDHTTVVE